MKRLCGRGGYGRKNNCVLSLCFLCEENVLPKAITALTFSFLLHSVSIMSLEGY